ncbi:MAG: hypothetical protein DWP97_08845 [Calditrichaeota bacterium]|nr:MAG: hypothetical protein DWP97_08845 [Calditrichota bacterium]
MVDDNKQQTKETVEIQNTLLEWTTHPMKKRPLAAVLVTVFILLIPLLVLSITESKTFATVALVVLFASVAKFYFPTKFKLTDKTVTIKGSTQTINRKWSEFRSYYVDKNGILLSPFIEPSRLENFRGMYLICNDNISEVENIIKQYVTNEAALEEKTE